MKNISENPRDQRETDFPQMAQISAEISAQKKLLLVDKIFTTIQYEKHQRKSE